MNDSATPGTENRTLIDVILTGGPAQLPEQRRTLRVESADQKVKVPYCGGYEHFERAAGNAHRTGDPIEFRWTGRTRIAE